MRPEELDPTNRGMAEYWNGEAGRDWVEQSAHYSRVNERYTAPLIDAAGIGPRDAVVDVGCGFGDTTLAAARAAAPGEVTGLDISEPMLALAGERLAAAGLDNVRFVRGDAQVHPFPPDGLDAAVSRFGVMFFGDPVAAFANIGRGLRAGGRLAVVVWQDVVSNEWMVVPGAAVLEHVPMPPPAAPGAPGPFSLADPDRVRAALDGFEEVTVDALSRPVRLGDDAADATAFVRRTGMGRALLGDIDPDTERRVVDAIERVLAPYETPDGVHLGSAAWLVTARRP